MHRFRPCCRGTLLSAEIRRVEPLKLNRLDSSIRSKKLMRVWAVVTCLIQADQRQKEGKNAISRDHKARQRMRVRFPEFEAAKRGREGGGWIIEPPTDNRAVRSRDQRPFAVEKLQHASSPDSRTGRPHNGHQAHALCDVARISKLSHHAFQHSHVSVQQSGKTSASER